MKTLKQFVIEGPPPNARNFKAHMDLVDAAEKTKGYSGKGHYLKKNGQYISDKHDSQGAALKTWQGLPDHEKVGVKIVHESEAILPEGWGAEAQEADRQKSGQEWQALKSKHKNNPEMLKHLNDLHKNNWKPSFAEDEATKRVHG